MAVMSTRSWPLAVFLVVAGALGLWASFALTLDKLAIAEDPSAELGCNVSLLVQCGANLLSGQGEVFGFPNPLLGLMGFVAPVAVGAGVLAGADFARWFWVVFNLGVAAGMALVIWLIGQSIYVLGTLCPWCMVVWAVMIPLFWVVTFANLAAGVLGQGLQRLGTHLLAWALPITVLSYLVVALLAQLRLDVLAYL